MGGPLQLKILATPLVGSRIHKTVEDDIGLSQDLINCVLLWLIQD